jgi:hypothetical protein
MVAPPLFRFTSMNIRNVLVGTSLLLGPIGANAQATYAGEQTIDKQLYKGVFLTVPLADRQVERDWEEQIKQFGRVTTGRGGVYRVTTADIRDLSAEPINLTSQVKGNKKTTTIFVAYDLGGGNYLSSGNDKYVNAEKMLQDFAKKSLFSDEVRVVEETHNESLRAYQKMVKKGENLTSDIESNKKEKERLLRKIDENAKELDQLQRDVETNKTDQANALADMENKRKNMEAVKAKKQ